MDHVAESRLRVRYAETDQMGIVYYSNYLVWMEVGRTDFCSHCGFRYRDMELEEGISIAVADAHCRYRAPARYDDQILIQTSLERLRRRTMDFAYRISNEPTGTLLAEGTTTHVAVDHQGRPRALPAKYHDLLSMWESPEACR